MSESKAPEMIWVPRPLAFELGTCGIDGDTTYRRADLPWLLVSPDEAENWIINEMGEHYAALLKNALEYRL